MTSLRARIVLLLILAIVSVVGLATFAATRALRPPQLEFALIPEHQQLRLLSYVATHDPALLQSFGVTMQDRPAAGIAETGPHPFLSNKREQDIGARDIKLTRDPQSGIFTASLHLESGAWLLLPLPNPRPPPDGWMVLGGWIIMIILGSTAVSIFAASKIIRPLELLEQSVGMIGPDGFLPAIPETGPGEVRATARALNRLSARLKNAIESRMRLVAAAGHDLRTPMTRMRLRAEFIPSDEERQKWLHDLEELDAIADSAIKLVKEETTSDPLETVRLDDIAREIGTELQSLDYQVHIGALAPLHVQVAPMAFKRALRNLVINAATHGGGAEITLVRRGNAASLSVTDHGPGIPEDLIGRVFEPFFRVDMARRKTVPGAGLGLAIAREIIERSGGDIQIANRPEGGLIQTITLPCTIQPSSRQQPPAYT